MKRATANDLLRLIQEARSSIEDKPDAGFLTVREYAALWKKSVAASAVALRFGVKAGIVEQRTYRRRRGIALRAVAHFRHKAG